MRKSVLLKQKQVEELKQRILDAQTVVAFDDLGLTVKQSTSLRVLLNEENCRMQIYKNNIVRRAFEALGHDELLEEMVGKKVLIFSDDDVVAPARIAHNFAKDTKKIELKLGIIEGKTAQKEEILQLATLPSIETILTQIAAGLLQPVQQLAVGLNMLVEAREESEV